MPLVSSQKIFIGDILEHLLIFPTTRVELLEVAKALNEAMEHDVPEENAGYFLRKCLLDPCDKFRPLERFNEAITIAEVKEGIIDLISDALTFAAEKAGLLRSEITWNSDQVKFHLVTDSDRVTPFISEALAVSNEPWPWELLALPDQIFTAKLVIQDGQLSLIVEMQPLFAQPDHEVSLGETTGALEVISHITPPAIILANKTAFILLQTYLKQENHFLWVISNRLDSNLSAQRLLLDKFYLDLFMKENDFKFCVESFTEDEVNILLNSTVKKIYQFHPDLCLLAKLKSVQINLFTLYFSYYQKNLSLFNELMLATEAQEKVLSHPVIMNLIFQDKLAFNQAKLLPIYIRYLLDNHYFYMEYFLSKPLPWKALQDMSDIDYTFLDDKKIIGYLQHHVFTLEDALGMPASLRMHLQQPVLEKWLLDKKMTWQELAVLSDDEVNCIAAFDGTNDWTLNDMIEISDALLLEQFGLFHPRQSSLGPTLIQDASSQLRSPSAP